LIEFISISINKRINLFPKMIARKTEMRKIKWWIDCRLFNKHRYDFYTGRCVVCNKEVR